ncbi:MAG: BatD family protein [Verrucomicrobiales bacterium]
MKNKHITQGALLLCVGLTFFWGTAASAQEEVEAALSANRVSLGQPVQLRVTIRNGQAEQRPVISEVQGLDIQHVGVQMRTEMSQGRNFQISSTQVHTYLVTPRQEGEFAIPPIEIRVNGQTLKTDALTLLVVGGSSDPAQADSEPELLEDETARGSIVLPRTRLFVGEQVPVSVRFSFDPARPIRLDSFPTFNTDGFTSARLSQPREEMLEETDGLRRVFTFTSTVSPLKSGSAKLGPATWSVTEVINRRRNAFPSMRDLDPTDPFSFDRLLQDAFDQNAFAAQTRQLKIDAPAVEIEVLPLPDDGKPDSFRGAIGNFQMRSTAEPLRLQPGEPLTLTLVITGEGNFDLVDLPQADDSAWRTYPPKVTFVPQDLVSGRGTKTFEYVMLPQPGAKRLPELEFSYFDPEQETYETLRSEPLLIEVLGAESLSEAPEEPGAAPVEQVQATRTPQETAEQVEERADIVMPPLTRRAWRPRVKIWKDPVIITVNVVAGGLFLGWMVLAWVRRNQQDEAQKALKQERKKMQASIDLISRTNDPVEFWSASGRLLARISDQPEAQELMKARDAALFAGQVPTSIDAGVRARLLKLVKQEPASSNINL